MRERKKRKNRIVYLIHRTWQYSAGRRHLFYGHIFLTLTANVFYLLQPLAIAKAFNAAQLTPDDPVLLRNVVFYLLLSLASWITFRILFHVSGLIETKNAFYVSYNFRKALVDKALALPVKWHQEHHSAKIISRIDRASNSLGEFSSGMHILLENTARAVGSIVVLSFFDWVASIVVVLACLSMALIVRFFDRRIVIEQKISNKEESDLAAVIHDSLSNITTIISLNLQPMILKRIAEKNLSLYPIDRRKAMLNGSKWSLAKLSMNVLTHVTIVLYAVSSYRKNGIVLIGTLFTLYKYLSNMTEIFNGSATGYSNLIKNEASVRDIEEIESAYSEMSSVIDAALPLHWKELSLSGIHFSYPAVENIMTPFHIDDLSLHFTRKNKIAFIGESGGGKSTLLYLLRGLYEARGKLLADGRVLPHGFAHFRQNTTFIPQHPEIFDTTVEQNITMDISYKKNEIDNAMRMACFNDVLDQLPHGMQTRVMEKGIRLSGGQKQRLALARGLLAAKQSDIILLDEPTSSVDVMTEMEIYKKIFTDFSEKTIVSTLHRLHLLPLFDYVYFIDKGNIVAEGNLEKLLEYAPFKEMWDAYNQVV